jgi:hypothetical protein
VVHGDLSPDTVFVAPDRHEVAILGGWWFAVKDGGRLEKLPQRTFELLPWSVRQSRRATHLVDQELVRATLRELLGDAGGAALQGPAPLVDFLRRPAAGEPVALYQAWHAVLERSFGRRTFVPLQLTADELYPAQ